MSENNSNNNIGKKTAILAMVFVFAALICQWSYKYYQDNPLKFPWGSKIFTVEADTVENLLPNEQTNYLGTRAAEESNTEFIYHAHSMDLYAASNFSIRTGPGVYYQSIGRMYYGRPVHVLGICEDNDWYIIDFYGDEAFVHSACLFEHLPENNALKDESEYPVEGSRSEDDVIADETDVSEPDETNEVTDPAEAGTTATPTPTPAPTATPTPAPASSVRAPTDPTMLELFNLVNQARAENGLEPLSWSNGLAADAAVRAQEIVTSFSHTRPDGSDWWTVDPDLMYGENLACGQSTAQEVFNSWWASPGHRANILGDYRTCGFALYYNGDAAYTYYWAQEFGY